ILSPKQFDQWLDLECKDTEKLMGLMQPYKPKDMVAYAVSLRVNSPKNDTATCIEPMMSPCNMRRSRTSGGAKDPRASNELLDAGWFWLFHLLQRHRMHI